MGAMIRVVRCNSCGLIYPEDYLQEWGRKYGIGLGPVPVCEGLQSEYNVAPKPQYQEFSSPRQVMHPVHVCGKSVSVVDVTPEEAAENEAILAITDPGMYKRIEVVREKQEAKSPIVKMLKSYLS